MGTKTAGTKGSWRSVPCLPDSKQRYWIGRCLAERAMGIALRDQATTALADAELTKGDASDLLDKLFACPRDESQQAGAGVYRTTGAPGTVAEGTQVITIVRPNKKYAEDPSQQGAGLYSMSLVPAPGTDGKVRWELVFDPEARAKLTPAMAVTSEAEISGVLAKASARAARAVRELLP